MNEKIDFYILNELFLNMGAVNSPAEAQGMLCGKLCGGQDFAQDLWLDEVLRFMDLEDVRPNEEQTSLLGELYQHTIRLLEDVNFRFAPLLPSDEATITRRVEELGYWCQGFLLGIGTSGLTGDSQLSEDVADAVRDLAQISQVGIEDTDELEENEVYWNELVEYVKVAVLTIYVDLSNKDNSSTKKVVH